MKRINPTEVPDLYRRIGMLPVQSEYCSDDGSCGCLITALMVDAGANVYGFANGPRRLDAAEEKLGFSGSYLAGLMIGFDGDSKPRRGSGRRAGHADGHAAWQALVEAGMTGGAA